MEERFHKKNTRTQGPGLRPNPVLVRILADMVEAALRRDAALTAANEAGNVNESELTFEGRNERRPRKRSGKVPVLAETEAEGDLRLLRP